VIEILVVKDYTNAILEFNNISIWIIYKKNLVIISVVFA
jgi:hypothetical protein